MVFKPNKIVKIYDYPDDPASCVGKGILLERTFKNALIQMWIVKELKTGKESQRVFYNKNVETKSKGGDV